MALAHCIILNLLGFARIGGEFCHPPEESLIDIHAVAQIFWMGSSGLLTEVPQNGI